jgi:hypothetical protein
LGDQEIEGCALRIYKSRRASTAKAGSMHVVIYPQFAFLEELLRSTFKDQSDVTVSVDRRKGERRKGNHPVTSDKRKMERRRLKAELLEVVIDA